MAPNSACDETVSHLTQKKKNNCQAAIFPNVRLSSPIHKSPNAVLSCQKYSRAMLAQALPQLTAAEHPLVAVYEAAGARESNTATRPSPNWSDAGETRKEAPNAFVSSMSEKVKATQTPVIIGCAAGTLWAVLPSSSCAVA